MLRKRPRKNEWKKELFCNKICRIDLACFLSVSLSWWKFSQCTVSVLNIQLTHSPFSLSHTFTSRYLSLSHYLHGSFLSLKPYIAFSLSHEHSSQFLHTYSIHRKRCIIHTPLKYTLWHFTHCLSLSLTHSLTLSLLSSKYDSSTLLLSPSFIFSIQSEIAWSTCDEGINVFLKQNSINFGRQQPNIKVSMYLLLTKQQPFWQ